MSNVVVCYKWVVDEADIRINSDKSLDFSKAKWKIGEYDKVAIEAAVQLAKTMDGKTAALTFGNGQAKQSLKDALSRGPEGAYWINSSLADHADGFVTGKVLAAAIQKIEDVSLVICAEGASDTYARQTAPRIGANLDWPVVTSVSSMEVVDNVLIAKRKLDDCIENVKVALPAVVAVLPDITEARLPGLKDVLSAGKKPVTELKAEELGIADIKPKLQVKAAKPNIMERKSMIITEGDALSKVKELATHLRKEGVL